MATRPDVSDPALMQAFEDVRNEKTPTNWVLYSYVPRSNEKIRVHHTGTGTSLTDMTDNMSEGSIHYGFFRYDVNGTHKFVFISWCGENVIGMQRGLYNAHSTFMTKFLHGYHVQINARSEEDLDEAAILTKLKAAAGSHGRKNVKAREQSTESQAAASSADAATASGHTRAVNQDDSASYWSKQRQQEEADKAARESHQQANLPRAGIQGGASSAKDRFTAAASAGSQPQASRGPVNTGAGAPSRAPPAKAAAPPPSRSAPPPVRSAPPPAAPPPPAYEEPAQTYEEPAYEEPAYNQEPAYEEQNYNQEPAYDENAGYDAGAAGGGGNGFNCRALYDYAGENAGDLSFNEGDIIVVNDDSDPSGWWSGEVHGVSGFFPSNFVERL
eukprot:TRINITY_DN52_c0_g1_i1.p1 TRINITY_DN52_c0_g1~~TRINITY_DN52_c0_g1_i1.p1  ORF type:complete len:386 (-),score=126.90 TRINITY_DN52_c0_g1_i1:105-1262(-)